MKPKKLLEYNFKERIVEIKDYNGENISELLAPKFINNRIIQIAPTEEELIYRHTNMLEYLMDKLRKHDTFGTEKLWQLFFNYNELTKDERTELNRIATIAMMVNQMRLMYSAEVTIKVNEGKEQFVFDEMATLLNLLIGGDNSEEPAWLHFSS